MRIIQNNLYYPQGKKNRNRSVVTVQLQLYVDYLDYRWIIWIIAGLFPFLIIFLSFTSKFCNAFNPNNSQIIANNPQIIANNTHIIKYNRI